MNKKTEKLGGTFLKPIALWEKKSPKSDILRYDRSKTGEWRVDRAEVNVCVEPGIGTFMKALQLETGSPWWFPSLHRWESSRIAVTMVSKYLRQWCQREGLEPFTFFAARHTWASTARPWSSFPGPDNNRKKSGRTDGNSPPQGKNHIFRVGVVE